MIAVGMSLSPVMLAHTKVIDGEGKAKEEAFFHGEKGDFGLSFAFCSGIKFICLYFGFLYFFLDIAAERFYNIVQPEADQKSTAYGLGGGGRQEP